MSTTDLVFLGIIIPAEILVLIIEQISVAPGIIILEEMFGFQNIMTLDTMGTITVAKMVKIIGMTIVVMLVVRLNVTGGDGIVVETLAIIGVTTLVKSTTDIQGKTDTGIIEAM